MNFMSVGNSWIEIQLDKHQTTLVVGKNGSGKSTILDAISFALFNKPFRNINKPQIANSITKHPCIVELEFTINGHNFVVRRGIRPDLFEIFKDDELITEASDVRDYQKAFEKYIIRVNHKTFCQIVMLGSAIFRPFMALTTGERRDIIEDLLDLKVFTRMNVLLKDQISQIDRQIHDKETEKRIFEERIDLTNKHIDELKKSNEGLIELKKFNLKDLERFGKETFRKIEGLNEKIASLSQNTIKFKSLTKKLDELNKIQHQLQHRSNEIQKDVKFFSENITCPTCDQNIDEEFKTQTTKQKTKNLKEINEALEKLSEHFSQAQYQIDEISKIQDQINEAALKIMEFQSIIRNNESNKISLLTEITLLEKKKEEINTTQLIEWEEEVKKIQSGIIESKDDQHIMSYATSLLKDSGIKSQIIKTYIPIINQLIQKYLAKLDFFVEFQIDEQFKEVIKSRFRDEFSYASFSQGEKLRLDLAILFAWRALAKLRGSIDVNILVFDEVMDSSLDDEGTENFIKLILNLTSLENTFIISHRIGSFEDKFSRVLHFEKRKNFSHLKGKDLDE